jgi:hypothetical protein
VPALDPGRRQIAWIDLSSGFVICTFEFWFLHIVLSFSYQLRTALHPGFLAETRTVNMKNSTDDEMLCGGKNRGAFDHRFLIFLVMRPHDIQIRFLHFGWRILF